MKLFKVCLFLIFLAMIASCSKDKYEIKVIDGVEYIKNRSVLQEKETVLKELFTIDLNDSINFCDSPVSKTIDSRGNIYIVNRKSCTIKQFDKNGKFINSFGNKGSGPGEFVSYGNRFMTTVFNDTLFVHDDAKQRYLKFDENSKFVESINLKGRAVMPVQINDKNYLALNITRTFSKNEKRSIAKFQIVLLDNKFNLVKEFKDAFHEIGHKIKNKEYIDMKNMPLDQYMHHSILKDGFTLSYFHDDRYEFEIFDFKGNRKKVVSKNYRPHAFKDSLDREKYGFGEKWKKRKFKRSVLGIYEDKDSNILVSTPKDEADNEGVKFDVFNKNGEFLYTTYLDIPVNSEFLFMDDLVFKDDKIYYFDFKNRKIKCYTYSFKG